jgi:hypothetical protein
VRFAWFWIMSASTLRKASRPNVLWLSDFTYVAT